MDVTRDVLRTQGFLRLEVTSRCRGSCLPLRRSGHRWTGNADNKVRTQKTCKNKDKSQDSPRKNHIKIESSAFRLSFEKCVRGGRGRIAHRVQLILEHFDNSALQCTCHWSKLLMQVPTGLTVHSRGSAANQRTRGVITWPRCHVVV